MKFLIAVLAVVALAHAEETTKEKRGILGGYGYGGYGLDHGLSLGHGISYSAPAVSVGYSGYHGLGYGGYHGLGYGGLGYGGLGYAKTVVAAPVVKYAAPAVVAAPIVKYAAPAYHAPIITKSYVAPTISLGYGGYGGHGGYGGYSGYGGYGYNKWW